LSRNRPPAGRGRRTAIGAATAVAALSLAAGTALAGGGGISIPDPPRVSGVACIDTCAGPRTGTEGSKVELQGRHLGNVRRVYFDGGGGSQIGVAPTAVAGRSVKAKVPTGTVTGRPKVSDSYGNRDGSPEVLEIVDPNQIPDAGFFKLEKARATPGKAFYAGKPAKVSYQFSAEGPVDVRIRVVRRSDGQTVKSWTQEAQAPGVSHTASWRGDRADRNGGYRFKIGPLGGNVESTDGARFKFFRYKFPVRGPHTYGDGIGAGRGHRGQDVFASCGTPLQAARGGTVQWKAYQGSGAGYYVVIDGKGTGRDYVYMHLRDRARVAEGEHVRTGERLGDVGESGNASGCHLHFEIWSAPGWYEGGSFTDPTGDLKRWDSWS
jgi:murein DD-endopeptidase MepM/ murein hydrolase activator NlpD